jgi:hypothetical protein
MLLSHDQCFFTFKHFEEGCNTIYAVILERYEVMLVQNLGIGIFAPKYLAVKGLT